MKPGEADELALFPPPSLRPPRPLSRTDLSASLSTRTPKIDGPDTRAVVWLDIDNTLYPKSSKVSSSTLQRKERDLELISFGSFCSAPFLSPDSSPDAAEDPRLVLFIYTSLSSAFQRALSL